MEQPIFLSQTWQNTALPSVVKALSICTHDFNLDDKDDAVGAMIKQGYLYLKLLRTCVEQYRTIYYLRRLLSNNENPPRQETSKRRSVGERQNTDLTITSTHHTAHQIVIYV